MVIFLDTVPYNVYLHPKMYSGTQIIITPLIMLQYISYQQRALYINYQDLYLHGSVNLWLNISFLGWVQ